MPLPVIAGAVSSALMTVAADQGVRGLMQTVLQATKNGVEISSLTDLARPTRVEPLVIVDQTLVDQPYMKDVMKFVSSSFTGYYLQAVDMLLGVDKIDTLKVFDTINPNRTGVTRTSVFSAEEYSDGLPSLESFEKPVHLPNIVAEHSHERWVASMEANDESTSAQSISSGDTQKIYEVENLAVGKLVNVDVKSGKQKAKIPVMIRLIPAAVSPQIIAHIFSAGGRDTWLHRLFLVKTGQIKFWRDFVLGQDMIDEHYRILMNDKSGVYKQITDRRRNNWKQSVRSGTVSLADASNIAIVSTSTLKAASNSLYGRIDDFATRQKIFDNSYLMMLVVIDDRYERVTIYHRGVDLSTSHRLDEIKMAEKNKGPDITEIFKMMNKTMSTNI